MQALLLGAVVSEVIGGDLMQALLPLVIRS